ncbi:hypothetical protein [Tenacibaculum sp. 190524A05c]|uniref:hypothetical protein n=1 Tax=Tenacibaculum platacis TaxID=3137852 RepID=UPI0032B1E061
MRKKVFTFLLVSIHFFSSSQEEIGSFINTLKNNDANILESFSVFNKKTKNIGTFLIEKKRIYGFLLDQNFNLKTKLLLDEKNKKYSLVLGKMYDSNNNFKIILSDKNKSKFAIITFNFSNGQTSLLEDTFSAKKLIFLQSISRDNKVHLLFLDRNSYNIVSRNYKSNGSSDSFNFDFSNEKFLITKDKEISLKKLIPDYSNPEHREIKNIAFELTKVSEESYDTNLEYGFLSTTHKRKQTSPISIETASKLSKLYIRKNDVVITFDKNKFYTQILYLDLNTGKYKYEKIEKPLFESKKSDKTSNSFIIDHFLLLITSTKKRLVFNIYNLKNKALIKQFNIKNKEPIQFSNTPIIQKGGDFKQYRELEKTKQFLRKISSSKIGISAFRNTTGYEITIGGRKLVTSGTFVAGVIGGGLMGAAWGISASPIYSSTNTSSFGAYLKNKSVHIKCLFDNNFNHLRGNIEKNIYDKIQDYNFSKRSPRDEDIYENNQAIRKQEAINVFNIGNETILGFYSSNFKAYYFYKF